MTRYLIKEDGFCVNCVIFMHHNTMCTHKFKCILPYVKHYRYATHKEIMQYRFRQAKKKLTDEV
jgi:hypothetical protein